MSSKRPFSRVSGKRFKVDLQNEEAFMRNAERIFGRETLEATAFARNPAARTAVLEEQDSLNDAISAFVRYAAVCFLTDKRPSDAEQLLWVRDPREGSAQEDADRIARAISV